MRLLNYISIILILTLTSPLFFLTDNAQALSIEPNHETNFQGQQLILTIEGKPNQTDLIAWIYYGSYFVKVFPNITLDENGTTNISFLPTIEWHVGLYDVYINNKNRTVSNETWFALKMNEELLLIRWGELIDKGEKSEQELQGGWGILIVVALTSTLLFGFYFWWTIWQPAQPWIWFKNRFYGAWARISTPTGSMMFRTLHANPLERHRFLYKKHKKKIRPLERVERNLDKKLNFIRSKKQFHIRHMSREREEVLIINPTDPHIRDEEIWAGAIEDRPSERRRLKRESRGS